MKTVLKIQPMQLFWASLRQPTRAEYGKYKRLTGRVRIVDTSYRTRGFDFAYAARAFFDPDRIIKIDNRHCYSEDRYQLMGLIEQRLFVLVYTPRQTAMRIISARKANQREVKHYENSTSND